MQNEYWNLYINGSKPEEVVKSVDKNLDLNGWRILNQTEAVSLKSGLKARYPNRNLVPIARRDDSDDIICISSPDASMEATSVEIIHDFADPGWETVQTWASISLWLDEWSAK